MGRKYLRIHEVVEICGVNETFIHRLEEEELIRPVVQHKQKLYPMDQVDRVRVAHVLFVEMRVNIEGVEVTLHMREQMIALQRKYEKALRRLKQHMEK